mgnify:CR=1 FL=1
MFDIEKYKTSIKALGIDLAKLVLSTHRVKPTVIFSFKWLILRFQFSLASYTKKEENQTKRQQLTLRR